MKSSRPILVLLAVFALLAAACTTNSDDAATSTTTATPTTIGSAETDAPTTDGTAAPATTAMEIELTASWTGVTEDSIKIGYLAIDAEALKEQFDYDLTVGPNADVLQAQIDATNAEGGINGRQVELVVEAFLPVGADDSTRACEILTTEEQIFLAIGNLLNDNPLCITEIHETPYLGMFGLTQERADRSRAPFVALEMAADKQRTNSIKVLLAEGDLEGKRVAVDWGVAEAPIAELVLPMLEEGGIDVVETTEREDFATDTAANEQEMDNAIQKWVAADAQIIIPLGGVVPPSLGIQRNNYEPEQVIFLNGQARNTDLFDGFGIDASKLDFVTAVVPARVTVEDAFADPLLLSCLDNYYASYPEAALLSADNGVDFYEGLGRSCSAWEVFRLAAEAAGADLTPDTWVAGVEAIGEIDLPSNPGHSFGPGKLDGGNLMQRYKFDPTLGYLVPDGDPIAVE